MDEPTPSDVARLIEHVRTHVVARRNARGGRSAAKHTVAALRVAGAGRPRRGTTAGSSSCTPCLAGAPPLLVQSATSSRRGAAAGSSPKSSVSCLSDSRSRAAVSSSASSPSVRAEPRCSTCSTTRPRRVTICTATAPEAVRTLRTNRDTTRAGFHARILSDHFDVLTTMKVQVTVLPSEHDLEGGTTQVGPRPVLARHRHERGVGTP
jgi:hypothetical protein